MQKLVFATNNPHKLREAREIIGSRIEVLSLADIGCSDEIPETADTLEGNAMIKARWVSEKYGCPCFADDTGLFVESLDGRPGVYTARFAGEHCSPADNITLLLKLLEGKENRKAYFRTVVAYSSPQREFYVDGQVDGRIPEKATGNGGFGYDPVFMVGEKSFAELTSDEKDAISHRGNALRELVRVLPEYI